MLKVAKFFSKSQRKSQKKCNFAGRNQLKSQSMEEKKSLSILLEHLSAPMVDKSLRALSAFVIPHFDADVTIRNNQTGTIVFEGTFGEYMNISDEMYYSDVEDTEYLWLEERGNQA